MKKRAVSRRSKIFGAVITVAALGIAAAVLLHTLLPVEIADTHYAQVQAELIDPNASDEAKRLMAYLKSIYGKQILSGQYINEYDDYAQAPFLVNENDPNSAQTVFKANELQAVYSVTGQYPALLGLDVSGIEADARCFSIEQAIEWHNAGGIVTICWHWLVDNFDGKDRAFYTDETDLDLEQALADTESAQYKGLISDIDKVSQSLQRLQAAGVPVLWRPLHEASGGWFWWGASGADAYKALWDLLYDRMTNVNGLHNLIWVYNGQDPAWYVGDDKCDMIGDDPYYSGDTDALAEYPANEKRFRMNYKTSEGKMIAMTENDYVPDIDAAFEHNTKWLTFCTWCREFVCAPNGSGGYAPVYASPYTSAQQLKAVYADDRVVTLDKLVSSGAYRNTASAE